MKSNNHPFDGINNLRVIATIGVIGLHASAGLITQFGKTSTDYWLTGIFFNSLTRFCVPLFVMISGALLLSKEYQLTDFVRKRVARILLPFLFYAFIYLLYYYIIRLIYGHHSTTNEIFDWLITQLRKGVSYHFWYIYMILGLYLFIPVLGKWIRSSSEKEILYFLLIWFISNLLTLPLFQDFKLKLELSYFTGYIGYLVLGYYISTKTFENIRRTKLLAIFIFSIGYIFTLLPTVYLSFQNNQMYGAYFSNFSPNITAMAVGIYLFFRFQTFENKVGQVLGRLICRYSFGVYLIHILVLKWLSIAQIHWNCAHPALAVPFTTILALLLSGVFVFGVSKLPYGKNISG